MKMISIEDLKRRIKEKFCNSCSTPYKDTDVIEMGEYCCDMVSDTIAFIDELPTIEAEPVKHGRWIDHEKLIGIFGALCDHMVDNGRCDVFCPYADTKDESDECEAWRTIQKIRRELKNETN